MSRDLGTPFASGNEAELFAWDGGRVLKLSKRVGDPSRAEREAAILRSVAPIGLAPQVDGVLEVNGRWGVVMERIERPMLASVLSNPGRVSEVLDLMVALHRHIHAVTAPDGVPNLKQRLATRIERAEQLTRGERDGLLAQLATMADGDRLCHGDFHPFNILGLDADARVIDWLDATRGPPAADVCRTYVLISSWNAGFARAYVDAYFSASGLERAEVETWLPLVAAARLSENVPAEFDGLAELARGAALG